MPLLEALCYCSVTKSCLTPCNQWTAAICAPLSYTTSWSLPRFVSIALAVLSNHLILCHSLCLLPSIFPSTRVFFFHWVSSWHQVAKVLGLQLQHQSFNEYSGWISFRIDWFDLLAVQGTLSRIFIYLICFFLPLDLGFTLWNSKEWTEWFFSLERFIGLTTVLTLLPNLEFSKGNIPYSFTFSSYGMKKMVSKIFTITVFSTGYASTFKFLYKMWVPMQNPAPGVVCPMWCLGVNVPSATSTKHWHPIVSAQVSSSLTSEPCFPTELDSFILGHVTYWLKNKTGSLHIVIFIWLTLTHISQKGQSLLKSLSNNVLVISLHLVSSKVFKVMKYSSLSSSNNI